MPDTLSSKFLFAAVYVIENEGGYSNDRHDKGGCTKYGITLGDVLKHPELGANTCKGVQNLTREDALMIYHSDYWLFENIPNWRVATKLMDVYTNLPPVSAVRLMQRAANLLGAGLVTDGIWGKHTETGIRAATISLAGIKNYLDNIVRLLHTYYGQVVQHSPSQAVFLRGWLRRADRLPS